MGLLEHLKHSKCPACGSSIKKRKQELNIAVVNGMNG